MKAKRIIPVAFMGLGALTAYWMYASTQKKKGLSEKPSIAASVQEVRENKPDKKTPAKKKEKTKKLASLKSDNADDSIQTVTAEKAEETQDQTSENQPSSRADLDKALKPILDKTYTEQELKTFVKAYGLYRKNRFTKAKPVTASISDPLIRLCLKWYRYKKNPGAIPAGKLKAFWKENSDWPSLDAMKAAVESDLLSAKIGKIRTYLKEEKPVSNAGLLASAYILLDEGKKDEAMKIVRRIWHKGRLSKSLDKIVMKRFGKYLTEEDHHIRAQRYLYEGRSKYVASALRVARKLNIATKKLLDVHIAMLRRSKKAAKKVLALSDKDKLKPNIIYARVKRFRKKKQYKEAWDLLKHAPNDPDLLVNPKAWWKEKRYLILEALKKNKFQIAYDIAKNHGQETANELIDAEFLAGWIALRYLKKPELGYRHFTALNKAADGPRSRSRSEYWLGRAALAQDRKLTAVSHFRRGARYFNTFYGQLSRQSFAPHDQHLRIVSSANPTGADIKRFQNRNAVKAVVLANQAKQDALAAKFLANLRYQITQPGEITLLAELAKRIGHTQQVVRIGKIAMFRGFNAAEYAYPTHAMPKFKPLGKLPERAFAFAIARQESEFNTKIKSHVGARGVMQVMPATAKLLARRHKIKYSRDMLTNDPSYNVSLGAMYITERLQEFSGSYIKTIAGYNAGPGRVRQWTKAFGDPNHKKVDPIDWIERIPFHETRNYVKKVLANMQVYRSLLGNPKKALQLRKDLYRGRKDSHKASTPLVAIN